MTPKISSRGLTFIEVYMWRSEMNLESGEQQNGYSQGQLAKVPER